jgi:hypothetical protein
MRREVGAQPLLWIDPAPHDTRAQFEFNATRCQLPTSKL